MLDRTSKSILDYVKAQSLRFDFCFIEDIAKELNLNDYEAEKAVAFLVKKCRLDYDIPLKQGGFCAVTLSHESRHWKEFKRIFTTEYLFQHWIAIVALVISLIAFIRTL